MIPMTPWIRFAIGGVLCVALSAGAQPWFDALSGAFVPADIAQDTAAARLFVRGINPYGPAIRQAHAELLDVPVEGTFPHFPHPPFSLIVSLPLAIGSFDLAAGLWFGFTVALIVVLALLLTSAVQRRPNGRSPDARAVWWTLLLLLVWPPVLYNLEKGQWSILLAVLLALSWHYFARSNWPAAAGWAGAAAAVKVYPVVLGAYFLLRSARGVVWFAGVGLTLTVLPLIQIGPGAFLDFLRESRTNMPYWESFPSVMFSIHGVFARLFKGGQWAEPLTYAPVAAVIAEVVIVGSLLGIAGWIAILARQGRADHGLSLAAWLVLLPALNPQSLGHNGVLLALPIAVVGSTLTAGGRSWQRWSWAIAVVLISIPKQTVWSLAPPPVGPFEGVAIVALPTWGTLLLFFVTASMALERVGEAEYARNPAATAAIPTPVSGVPDRVTSGPRDFCLIHGRQLWCFLEFLLALGWPFLCKELRHYGCKVRTF